MGVVRPDLYLPPFGNISLMDLHNLYYFVLITVAAGILTSWAFLKTPLANAVLCAREKDVRASFLGYNVFLTKLAVFSASGIFAGLAGGLFVLFHEFVGTSCVDMDMSMSVVLMTVIGGPGHFLGPVLGAAFYVVFQDWISSITKHWWIPMGALFIFVVLYLEGGLISVFTRGRIWGWRGRQGKPK